MNQPKDIAIKIAELADGKKGENTIILDVHHLTSITDFFVITGARNAIQARAIAEDIEEKLSELGIDARRREGYTDSRWIVLDYSSVIVHVFHIEEREYYNIERLWMDGSNQIAFT